MKRLFLLFLFALTALSFTACSSSDDNDDNGGGGLTEIKGHIIIPNTAKYIYVYADTNDNKHYDEAEVIIAADTATGEFTLTAASAAPLVAEFYYTDTDPYPAAASSGVKVTAAGNSLPELVYTTPAGKSTISAFTTMVKNEVDLNPVSYDVEIASDKVRLALGVSGDLFAAESYTGELLKINSKVSEVVKGLLAYIKASLGVTEIAASHIAALYSVVEGIVGDIADDPDGYDTAAAITGAESGIEDDIEAAEEALEEAKTAESWNTKEPITVYDINDLNNNGVFGGYIMGATLTGDIWKDWDYEPISTLKSERRLTPTIGEPKESFTLEGIGFNVEKSTVTSPSKIYTTPRYGSQEIPLPAGAKVYTLFVSQNFTKRINTISELRNAMNGCHADDPLGVNWMGCVNFNSNKITPVFPDDTNDIITKTSDNTFNWVNTGGFDDIFTQGDYPFVKSGTYTVNGSGENETYTFTASDGSKAFLFHPTGNGTQWILATYPIKKEALVFFNDKAAEAIRDNLDLTYTPSY
jgi:hypothetical protein